MVFSNKEVLQWTYHSGILILLGNFETRSKKEKRIPEIIWHMSNSIYILRMPKAIPAIRQMILTAHTQRKECLMWSWISTSARPTPKKVAGTTGLINVAQLRHTTMVTAICTGSTPNFSPTPINTGNRLQSAVANGHWCGGKRPQGGASTASLN